MLQPRQPRWRQQQLRTHTHHPHEAYSSSSEHTHSSSCSLPPVHFPIIRQFLQRGSGVGDGRGCWEEWGYCSWVDRGGLEGGGMARSFSFLSLGCFFFLLVSSSFLSFFFLPLLFLWWSAPPRKCSVQLGEEQGREGKRWASAAYRRDVNSSVDVERIRCSSERESVHRLSISHSLSLSLTHTLSCSPSHPLSLPASLTLSAVSWGIWVSSKHSDLFRDLPLQKPVCSCCPSLSFFFF